MSLWSKGFNRNKTGEKRIEEKTILDIYLENVEWVDIGHDVLYARNDFSVDENLLSINDIKLIEKDLPTEISIMNKNHFKWIQDNCKIIKYQNENFKNTQITTSICCINEKMMEYINFNLPLDMSYQKIIYYIKTIESNTIYNKFEINEIGVKKFPSYLGTTKIICTPISDNENKQYNIKLVKLK